MFIPLDALTDLINSTIAGLPTLVLAAVPFIIGLVVGILLRKILKWAVIIGVIILIIAFFGFFGLNFGILTGMVEQYVPIIYAYAIILIGLFPIGVGFIIGLIIGLMVG